MDNLEKFILEGDARAVDAWWKTALDELDKKNDATLLACLHAPDRVDLNELFAHARLASGLIGLEKETSRQGIEITKDRRYCILAAARAMNLEYTNG